MTKEELMMPRFKVIADYPDSQLTVGAVYYADGGIAEGQTVVSNPDNYPHLFKKLQWHEERKPEDMPMFLKRHTGNAVYVKVSKWWISYGQWHYDCWHERSKMKDCHISDVFSAEPITESEYLAFKNK